MGAMDRNWRENPTTRSQKGKKLRYGVLPILEKASSQNCDKDFLVQSFALVTHLWLSLVRREECPPPPTDRQPRFSAKKKIPTVINVRPE